MSARRHGLWALALIGCAPVFPTDLQVVDEARILAIRSLPAEARPRDPVTWEALVAGPEGTVETQPQWAWCTEPRRAEERTAVSAACALGDGLEPTTAATTLPAEACSRFGPTPLPAEEGEPDRRPADPDPSGGYYQPVRASIDEGETQTKAFGRARVRCDLAGATRAIFDAFEDRYTANAHPSIEALGVLDQDGELELVLSLEPGSVESYVIYRAESSALIDATEALTVTWYATSGTLAAASTPIEALSSRVRWTPDPEGTPSTFWAVVRDDRGGSDWTEVEFTP